MVSDYRFSVIHLNPKLSENIARRVNFFLTQLLRETIRMQSMHAESDVTCYEKQIFTGTLVSRDTKKCYFLNAVSMYVSCCIDAVLISAGYLVIF